MQIGCYYESWFMPYTNTLPNDLTYLQKEINTVYLAFARPDLVYTKGQKTFVGTGLEFSPSFSIIASSIKLLQERKVKVILALGGGSYWSIIKAVNTQAAVDLMNDLGCDGIDIDWEVGISDVDTPVKVIDNLRKLIPGKIISFTCFSTGVYPETPNDPYAGMNVKALQQCSKLIDQVNVMAYDAGPKFDTIAAVKAYQKLYDGKINIGFEIGKQGWGGALLKKDELVTVCTTLKSPKIGAFFWAYYSDPLPDSISRQDAVVISSLILNTPTKPVYTTPSSVYIECPSCKTRIKNSWSVE